MRKVLTDYDLCHAYRQKNEALRSPYLRLHNGSEKSSKMWSDDSVRE